MLCWLADTHSVEMAAVVTARAANVTKSICVAAASAHRF